jgi:hypothetical protein
MDFLIPIAFFGCIAYVFKVVVDARVRGKILAANVPEDLIRSMLQVEEMQKRHGALRWGVVMVCMAIGFAFIDRMDWHDAGPGAIAILLGATGLGNLAFYVIARKSEGQNAASAR